jgi:hypothetical protein
MAVFSGNGTNAAPSFTFSSDTNTGMYRGTGPDTLFFTTNGSNAIEITSSQFVGVAISPLERFSVAGGCMLVDNTIPEGANQSNAYLKVGQASYTGAITDPSTFGIQHWMKTDSTSRSRLTIDSVKSGSQAEIFSITSDGRVFLNQPATTSFSYGLDVKTHDYAGGQSGGVRLGEGGANPDRSALRLMQKVTGGGVPYAEIIGPADGNGYTVFSNGSSSTEVFRSTANNYLRMASGTGGIQFNGDSTAANALDDYEEGSWTPGNLDADFIVFVARYIKIGRLVHAWFVTINSNTSNTYDLPSNVQGLPYVRTMANPYGNYGLLAGTVSVINTVTYTGSQIVWNGVVTGKYNDGDGCLIKWKNDTTNSASNLQPQIVNAPVGGIYFDFHVVYESAS